MIENSTTSSKQSVLKIIFENILKIKYILEKSYQIYPHWSSSFKEWFLLSSFDTNYFLLINNPDFKITKEDDDVLQLIGDY